MRRCAFCLCTNNFLTSGSMASYPNTIVLTFFYLNFRSFFLSCQPYNNNFSVLIRKLCAECLLYVYDSSAMLLHPIVCMIHAYIFHIFLPCFQLISFKFCCEKKADKTETLKREIRCKAYKNMARQQKKIWHRPFLSFKDIAEARK